MLSCGGCWTRARTICHRRRAGSAWQRPLSRIECLDNLAFVFKALDG